MNPENVRVVLEIIENYPPEEAVFLIKSLFEESTESEEEGLIKKSKITKVINCFETGKISGDYSKISIFKDGPNDIKQITYGIRQTTEFGNLPKLIKDYSESDGEFSEEFMPYVGRVGKKPSLHSDSGFKKLLESASSDPVMQRCQDSFFEDKYWKPAKKWFEENGFKENLSMLVVLDSFIHSGGILSFLRKRFAERPPAAGGSEREWIKQYVNARHSWLATHRRPILRNTVYRTNCFKEQIEKDNWNLEQPINANGIIVS